MSKKIPDTQSEMNMIPDMSKPTQLSSSRLVIILSILALVVIVLVWFVWRDGWLVSTPHQPSNTASTATSTKQDVLKSLTSPVGASVKATPSVIKSLTSPVGAPVKVPKSVIDSLTSQK